MGLHALPCFVLLEVEINMSSDKTNSLLSLMEPMPSPYVRDLALDYLINIH